MEKNIYLSLGSNRGKRETYLDSALYALSEEYLITAVSPVYETEPLYIEQQNWFLNCVAQIETTFSPKELLGFTQGIECVLGRERQVKYGPRTIDIDILLYGKKIINERGNESGLQQELQIPHPLLHERLFVLKPLHDVAPFFVHPVIHKTIDELLQNVDKTKKVRKWR